MADGVLTLIIDCRVTMQGLNVEDLHQVPPGSALPGRMVSSLGRGNVRYHSRVRRKDKEVVDQGDTRSSDSLPIQSRSCEVDTARQRSADIVNCKGYFLNLFRRPDSRKEQMGSISAEAGREKIKGPNHGAFSRLPPN